MHYMARSLTHILPTASCPVPCAGDDDCCAGTVLAGLLPLPAAHGGSPRTGRAPRIQPNVNACMHAELLSSNCSAEAGSTRCMSANFCMKPSNTKQATAIGGKLQRNMELPQLLATTGHSAFIWDPAASAAQGLEVIVGVGDLVTFGCALALVFSPLAGASYTLIIGYVMVANQACGDCGDCDQQRLDPCCARSLRKYLANRLHCYTRSCSTCACAYNPRCVRVCHAHRPRAAASL